MTPEQQQEAIELLRELVNTTVLFDPIPGLPQWYFCRECHGAGYTRETVDHSQRCKAARAQALLAAIESEATE
jgi:hypothetical protein